jgi:hypothetical protein
MPDDAAATVTIASDDANVTVSLPPGPMSGPMQVGTEPSGEVGVSFPSGIVVSLLPTAPQGGEVGLPGAPIVVSFPSGGGLQLPAPPVVTLPGSAPPLQVDFAEAGGFTLVLPRGAVSGKIRILCAPQSGFTVEVPSKTVVRFPMTSGVKVVADARAEVALMDDGCLNVPFQFGGKITFPDKRVIESVQGRKRVFQIKELLVNIAANSRPIE